MTLLLATTLFTTRKTTTKKQQKQKTSLQSPSIELWMAGYHKSWCCQLSTIECNDSRCHQCVVLIWIPPHVYTHTHTNYEQNAY